MSESNYNFRQALKDAKSTKKTEASLEADKLLRTVITGIATASNIFSEEALKEFMFLQNGSYINVYIRNLNAKENDKFPFTKLICYSSARIDDATNILLAIRSKLRTEEFIVESYTPPDKEGINGFILYTEEKER